MTTSAARELTLQFEGVCDTEQLDKIESTITAALRAAEQRGIEKCAIWAETETHAPGVGLRRKSDEVLLNGLLLADSIRALAQGGE